MIKSQESEIGIAQFPLSVLKMTLKYECLYDMVKHHTVIMEGDPKFIENKKTRQGIAGLASLVNTVVSTG